MQPQDTGFDWGHALSAIGGGAITALGAAIGWIYRAGGKEPTLKADFHRSLIEAEKRMETKIESAENSAEKKLDGLTDNFHEYFDGIRRQIDEHKLHTSENFVRKDDFKEFRIENREILREIKSSLDTIIARKH